MHGPASARIFKLSSVPRLRTSQGLQPDPLFPFPARRSRKRSRLLDYKPSIRIRRWKLELPDPFLSPLEPLQAQAVYRAIGPQLISVSQIRMHPLPEMQQVQRRVRDRNMILLAFVRLGDHALRQESL